MTTKKLLEKKDWNYYVYEDDHTIQLSVPIPKPTPGFDVLHTLNESEKEQYLNKGITTLESSMLLWIKNFLLTKSHFLKGGTIQLTEELQTVFENNRIIEIRTKNTGYLEGKDEINQLLQVVQEYDSKGNPTVIYACSNAEKKKWEQVIY